MTPLLSFDGVTVRYRRGSVPAVRNLSLDLFPGESLGIAGESGSGKSTLALVPLRLIPEEVAEVTARRMAWEGRDLLSLSSAELRALRGGAVGTIFQDPFSALNPVLTVGEQLEEVLELHAGGRNPARARDWLARVLLPDPARVYDAYPHQLSGGQRQRVCLAMAMAGKPQLLIADEPTTALDVTVQREILQLIQDLQRETGMAVMLISHNVGLLAERTQRIAVMYAGEIVELGPTAEVLSAPRHPYTQGLLRSLPRLSRKEPRLAALPGQPPDPRRLPSGCPFRPRCPRVFDRCAVEAPRLLPCADAPHVSAACHDVRPLA